MRSVNGSLVLSFITTLALGHGTAFEEKFRVGVRVHHERQRGELDLAVDNQRLLVTDGSGRRTGFDPAVGQPLQEIPQSAYYVDALANDATGAPATSSAAFVNIFQPPEGTYQVVVVGHRPGTYKLSIRGFADDGSSQSPVSMQGITDGVATSLFKLQYNASPGIAPVVIRVVTFASALQDIANSLKLGLIHDTGVATSLTQQIEAAQRARAKGQTQASADSLRAFQTLVQAQRTKQIQEIAARVLLDDGAHLSAPP